MRFVAAFLMLFPTAGLADAELIAIYGPMLEKCYNAGHTIDQKSACIGDFADRCMTQEHGGQSTFGISSCMHSESIVWDSFLDQEYVRAKEWAVDMDRDDVENFPEYANRVKALRNAQRAWITFRDAECELAYAVWGAGSMRHIASSSCVLDQTANRAIELWSLWDEMR